jgi:hypothetical protein
MSLRLIRRLYLLSSGAALLGILQALGQVNFNQILFQFLSGLASLLVTIFLGGDPSLFSA